METWTHRYESTRGYSSYGPGCLIQVEAGLHHLSGNARPYFSVTAAVGTMRQLKTGDWQMGGCCHEHVLRMWPKLAPVVALHLSDDTGTPMHAEANGWYQLAGYYGGAGERYHSGNGTQGHTPEECLQYFAEHVRISTDEARRIADIWRGDGASWPDTRRMFGEWLAGQSARFQAEADAAIALLDSL